MDLTNPAPIPGDLELKPNEATLVTVLHERSLLHPEKRAFVFLADGSEKEISITYGELDLYARRAAVKLTEIGLKGKKVLMFYPSGIDFIVAFFGCLIAGVIPVPLYPPRKNRSLQRVHSIASNCGSLSILTITDISITL